MEIFNKACICWLFLGSFATASCLICKYKVDCEAVRGDIFNQVIYHPYLKICACL